jgi:hypothetical protein
MSGRETMTVIRVSIGHFEPENADVIKNMLEATKAELEPGIRALPGNLAYWAGIDRENCAMTDVCRWESHEAAKQMATFQPMVDLAGQFITAGVRFQRPILNFEELWGIPRD